MLMYEQIIYKDLWNPEAEVSVQVLQHHVTELQSETGCVCVCVWDYLLEGLELIYAGIHAFSRLWQSSESCRGSSADIPSRPAARRTIRRHSARMMWRARTSALMFLTGNDLICSDWSWRTRTRAEVSCLDSFVRLLCRSSRWLETSRACDSLQSASLWVRPGFPTQTDLPCVKQPPPRRSDLHVRSPSSAGKAALFSSVWFCGIFFFHGRNFRQISSSRDVKPAAWRLCGTGQMMEWFIDIYNKGSLRYLHTSLCYLQKNIHVNFALWFLRYYCDIYRYFKQQGNWIS